MELQPAVKALPVLDRQPIIDSRECAKRELQAASTPKP